MTSETNCDRFLLIEISILILFGLLMVYSASMFVGALRGNPSYFFVRQSLFAGIAYILMIGLMFLDYHVWLRQRIITLLSTSSAVTLILVFIHDPVKGSCRSLEIGPVSFQPSEMAKLVILFYLAFYLQRHQTEIKQPGFRPLSCLMFVGLFVGLIGIEPDFGQALFIVILAILLFFVAGLYMDRKYIWSAVFASVPAFYFWVWNVPYRRARIIAWVAALKDILSAPHHPRHAGIAIGRGGLWGVGLGEGREKFLFLPEAFGDFIYAIIGEEFGLIGSVLILAGFVSFIYWGVKISMKAPDLGGLYLGLGITLMLALQALIHISAVLSLIPTKGLTLPFISQGGSSLFACLMATGVLLNISSQRKTNRD